MAEQYSICYGHDDFSIYNEKGERIKWYTYQYMWFIVDYILISIVSKK
jgi:hypothetical protein